MLIKVILLLVAIVQAVAPLLLYFNGFDEKTGQAPTPIVPAGYAFSIWGLIYGLSVVYALLEFMPGNGGIMLQRIGWPVIGLFALSTLWLAFARYGPLWATIPTILAMLALAVFTLVCITADMTVLRGAEKWVMVALFGLYAGWLTIATLANVTEIAAASGFDFFGLSVQSWTIIALIIGTAVACAISFWTAGAWSYAAAVCWALAAIAAANLVREQRPAIVAVSAIGLVLVLAVSWTAARDVATATNESI